MSDENHSSRNGLVIAQSNRILTRINQARQRAACAALRDGGYTGYKGMSFVTVMGGRG